MLLGTITPRIQSRPAAGEMVKQTPVVPYPALLSSHDTSGQIRALGSPGVKARWVLPSAEMAPSFLLRWPHPWHTARDPEATSCSTTWCWSGAVVSLLSPGPARLPHSPSPAPGLPVPPRRSIAALGCVAEPWHQCHHSQQRRSEQPVPPVPLTTKPLHWGRSCRCLHQIIQCGAHRSVPAPLHP